MRASILFVLTIAAAGLAACSPAGPTHDKAYYAGHAAERASKLAACRNDPGRLAATPPCVNAQGAEADAHAEHAYDLATPAPRVTRPGAL